jgi:hypothetical protein
MYNVGQNVCSKESFFHVLGPTSLQPQPGAPAYLSELPAAEVCFICFCPISLIIEKMVITYVIILIL